MLRLLTIAVLALFGAATTLDASSALTEKRVALVIGNSDYKNPNLSLLNPKNDSSDIAAVLKSLDFEVQLVTNAGKREFDGILERFARQAATADAALFYYAGHAIQYQGKNYLMPVDAELEDEISIRYNLVSIDDARSALDRVSGVKILVLDACRNNPITERLNRVANGASRAVGGATRGLARIDKTQGMVVSYATAADEVAYDGKSTRNSPYTAALIRRMQEPGLEIEIMFRRVAADVNAQTGGRQRPETSITLLSEYYLNQTDRRAWENLRDTTDIEAIKDFLRRYPNSVSSLDAKYRLEVLERAKREREDEEARQQREAYRRELAEREAAARAEIQRLEEERRRADQLALERDAERQRAEKARLAKIEEDRRLAEQKAAEQAALEKRQAQERLAKIEADRVAAAKALADQKEAEQKRQAAEKLAALETQRLQTERETAQREAARINEQESAKTLEENCRSERAALDALGSDESKINQFVATSKCEGPRMQAQNMLASLNADRERVERACSIEERQLAALKIAGALGRNRLAAMKVSLTCDRLAPMIDAALAKADAEVKLELVRTSQAELRRIGCYRGAENGELNELTKSAIKKANVARGLPEQVPEISEDFVTGLKELDAPVCLPPRVEPEEPKVSKPRPTRKDNERATTSQRKPAREQRDQQPTARAERSQGSYGNHGGGGGGGGGGSTGTMGLSF